ncbi:MAG: M23 family metallopeptidase [Bacteroidales bacterium]|nr:M23 family metallopeptidase [Bacteroidales bacterium]
MRHKTSVLIVNSKEKESKVRQVPTHIIVNWRKYTMLLAMLVVAFFLVSGFLIYQNTSRSYQERLDRANYIRNQIDVNKALTAFASIDSGIYRLNSFLHERGLEQLKIENAGGVETDFDIIHINEFASFYQNQIEGLEEILSMLPIGKPYDGSITSSFGYRRNPFTGAGREFHSGVDFRGRVGDSIQTTGDGVVSFAGPKGGLGRCVIIEHNENLQTLYAHLHRVNVVKGQQVSSGEVIGFLGNTGRSTGPHLHYEIILNNKKINPKIYFNFETEKGYD